MTADDFFSVVVEDCEPPKRTSSFVRAIIRVRRLEEKGYGQFEISISPRTRDWHILDWIHESTNEIVDQISRARKLKLGQAATFDVVLKPWSSKYWTDCGYEYDAGFDLTKFRTLRCSKRFQP